MRVHWARLKNLTKKKDWISFFSRNKVWRPIGIMSKITLLCYETFILEEKRETLVTRLRVWPLSPTTKILTVVHSLPKPVPAHFSGAPKRGQEVTKRTKTSMYQRHVELPKVVQNVVAKTVKTNQKGQRHLLVHKPRHVRTVKRLKWERPESQHKVTRFTERNTAMMW